MLTSSTDDTLATARETHVARALAALGFEVPQQRGRDALDFVHIAVWRAREALEAAYDAGLAAGIATANKGSA